MILWSAYFFFFYEIRKILTLIYVSLAGDPGYFMD